MKLQIGNRLFEIKNHLDNNMKIMKLFQVRENTAIRMKYIILLFKISLCGLYF
jgi:hypothetical protein